MLSSSKRVQEWRTRTKQTLVNCFGGKCNKCSYDKCVKSLDFHHLKNKSFGIAQALCRPKNIEVMIEEIKKCIVLCRNCHGELHAGLWKIEDINCTKFNPDLYVKHMRDSKEITCKCGIEFKRTRENRFYCSKKCKILYGRNFKDHNLNICICGKEMKNRLYCSNKCSSFDRRKAERPSKEELEKMVWEKATTKIAKEFGVTDKTIGKWCLLYSIQKPPRGYWSKQNHTETKELSPITLTGDL